MAATTEAISAEKYAELQAENARLKQQNLDFAEQQKQAKTEADHAANLSFAEGLVKSGQLLPAQKDLLVSTLDFMAGQEQVVEFGEGDAKKLLLEAVKSDLFGKLPKQIEFGEIAGDAGVSCDAVNFAAPDGLPVDPSSARLHQQVEAYALKHNVDYATALAAVGKR